MIKVIDKTFHYYCDVCGEELESNGWCLLTDPGWYEHECGDSGEEYDLRFEYPCTFEEAEKMLSKGMLKYCDDEEEVAFIKEELKKYKEN